MGLPIRPCNEATNCTLEDCQFLTTKNFPSVKIKSEKNVSDFFFIVEGFFIMNLHQMDKHAAKYTIWKYWKGCVKKLEGNDRTSYQQLMDLASRQCTRSHGTVCEGVFSY